LVRCDLAAPSSRCGHLIAKRQRLLGEDGMNPRVVFVVLIVLGAIWTGVLMWVFRARPPVPYSELAGPVGALRRRLLYPLIAAAVLVFLVSTRWVAYPAQRVRSLGQPRIAVEVQGLQFAWILSRQDVPLGAPIEFRVTAQDVNHGFGIYSPEGLLVAQVQAMPHYTNRLVVRFDRPGTYTVRCLEYCGVAHHVMATALTVQ
jgi:cytochrome c oxidase subunit 2